MLGAKCISWNTLNIKNETCEPMTSPTQDSLIVECKMYMTKVLGAKCISRNMLDMKNETCEPVTLPTRNLGGKCIWQKCWVKKIYYGTS